MKLVLLPGLDGTGALFADFVVAMPGVGVQIIDYPRDRAMNYAEHQDYARERLPKDECFVLLGESFSGPVAIALAAEAPVGLSGLVLCCSFASNPLPRLGLLSRLVAVGPALKLPARWFAPWLYAGHSTPEIRRAHARAMSSVSARTLRARVAAVLSVDYRDRLRAIQAPILYLRARRDRLVPLAALKAIEGVRSDIHVETFDAPHFLLQTRPRECAEVVRNFLSRCCTPA